MPTELCTTLPISEHRNSVELSVPAPMAGQAPLGSSVDFASRNEPASVILDRHPETPKGHSSNSLPRPSTERKESTAAERLRTLHAQATVRLRDKLHASDSTKPDAESSKSMQDRLMNL
jgi:hypothetical protein